MKFLVLHRYPIDLAIGTNPSFPFMLEYLNEKASEITLLSFKGNSKKDYPKIHFKELGFSFDRGNSFDKLTKSFLWLFLAPFVASRLAKKKNVDLIYCDDSIPYYPFFIKLLVGKKRKVCHAAWRFADGIFFCRPRFY